MCSRDGGTWFCSDPIVRDGTNLWNSSCGLNNVILREKGNHWRNISVCFCFCNRIVMFLGNEFHQLVVRVSSGPCTWRDEFCCFSPLTCCKSPKLVNERKFLFVFPQAKYISQCIDEIKQELKQDNIAVKANAVCKLTYVSAYLGYAAIPSLVLYCWLGASLSDLGTCSSLTGAGEDAPTCAWQQRLHIPILFIVLALGLVQLFFVELAQEAALI